MVRGRSFVIVAGVVDDAISRTRLKVSLRQPAANHQQKVAVISGEQVQDRVVLQFDYPLL
jgi:hypothetical protein